MPRIPFPDTGDDVGGAAPRPRCDRRACAAAIMPAPYRPALHAPELADKWQQLGELLRYRTSLPTRLSELAVLVVARHHDCQYVWQAHAPVALKAGVAPDIVEAIRTGHRPAAAQPDETAVYDYASELLRSKFVSDAAYAAAYPASGGQRRRRTHVSARLLRHGGDVAERSRPIGAARNRRTVAATFLREFIVDFGYGRSPGARPGIGRAAR